MKVQLLTAALILSGCQKKPAPEPGWNYQQAPAFGMAVGLYPKVSQKLSLNYPPDLKPVAERGVQSILLPVPWKIKDNYSETIYRGDDTPADRDLLKLFAEAQRLQLSVTLMPFLVLESGPEEHWRGTLAPKNPALFWQNYRRLILRYGQLAQEYRLAGLVIGSELTSLSTWKSQEHWQQLSTAVKKIYSGPLIYAANHDALDHEAPFSSVDILGVSAYFPLAEQLDASADQMRLRFSGHLSRLKSWAQHHQKPLLLLELGFPSIDGAALQPWNHLLGAPLDPEEQGRAYRAVTEELSAQPEGLEGVYFWIWFGKGGPHDRFYTPRNKPAEKYLRKYLESRKRKSPEEG